MTGVDSLDVRIRYELQVFAANQALIPLADAKAAAIIAANLAFIGGIIHAPAFLDKFRKILELNPVPLEFPGAFGLFAVCSCVSTIAAVLVLFPRPGSSQRKLNTARLTFFGDIVNRGNPERYLNAVDAMNPEEILKEVCNQTFELSTILVGKYQMTKIALTALIGAFVSWIAFFVMLFRYAG